MSDTSLIFSLIAKDKASGEVGGVGKAFDNMSKLIIGGAIAAGAALVKIGADFDQAVDTIRVGTGATGPALAALKVDFKRAFESVPADAKTVAEALAEINKRTGATGVPLQQLTKQFVELSRITGTDVSTNIAAVTRAFGDWGIKSAGQSKALDALFRASQKTGMGVAELAQKVVQFGAPLRQFGFSFEQSAALMGKWEKEGVNTQLVLGGLKIALGKVSKAGKDPANALADLQSKIRNAGSSAAANKIAIEAFGQRAGPDMAAAIREGRFSLGDLYKTVKGGKETILGAAKDTMDWQEKLQLLKNKAFVALEPVATKVFNALGKGADKLGELTKWAERNQGAAKGLAIALGSVAAIILAVNVALKVHATYLAIVKAAQLAWTAATKAYAATAAIIRGATIAWTAVQWLLNVAMTANPIGIIIVAVAALIGIIILIATKTTWFQTLWKAIWSKIGGPVKAIWGWIKAHWPLLLKIFTGPVGLIIAHWGKIKNFFTVTVPAALRRFANWVVSTVKGAAQRGFLGPVGLIIMNWTRIKNYFTVTLPAGIRRGVDRVVGFVKSLPGKIRSAVGNLGSLLVNAGRNLIQGLINGITGMIGSLRSKLGGITNMLPNWKGPLTTDLRLLEPSGAALMTGLIGGITRAVPRLRSALGGVTAQIPATVNRGAGGGRVTRAGGGAVRVEIDVTGADDHLLQRIRKTVRVVGRGNVQVAFGTGRA